MPNEKQIEQEIQDKGLNAPRLTPADIDAAIAGETYTNLPDGRTVVCQLTLKNGFTIDGKSACVSKANFNQEIGNKIARDNAREKIWELEGYLLKEKLHQQKAKVKTGVDELLEARIPILDQIYELCLAIEKCGASPELTDAVRLAGELRNPISELVRQAVDLGIGQGIVAVSYSVNEG